MAMHIQLLGTGTPTPSLRRMSAGYLLRTETRTIVFDCGPGVCHRLLEAGVRPQDVTDVFITHLHYDHCLDLVRLLLTHWDQGAGRVPALNVYGPPPIARMVDTIVGDDGLFGADLRARTRLQMSVDVYEARGGTPPRQPPTPVVRELASGDEVECGDCRVRAAAVIHAQPELDCLGFRLEHGGSTFAYSGDAGPCASMQVLASGSDVLVHMCHFLSGTALSPEMAKRNMGHLELANLGNTACVRNLVVSHVSEQMDVPGIRERIVREMADIYGGNLFFGEDLMVIPVGDPAPAKLD